MERTFSVIFTRYRGKRSSKTLPGQLWHLFFLFFFFRSNDAHCYSRFSQKLKNVKNQRSLMWSARGYFLNCEERIKWRARRTRCEFATRVDILNGRKKYAKPKLRVSVFFSWYPCKNNNSTNTFRQMCSNMMDANVQGQTIVYWINR